MTDKNNKLHPYQQRTQKKEHPMSETISQLQTFIKKGNLGKAATILLNFSRFSETERQKAMEVLALAPNSAALFLLEFIVTCEATTEEDKEIIFQLVTDRAHIHSPFVLILLQHAPFILINRAAPLIRHILNQETDIDLLGRVISITGKKKINLLTDDLTEYLFYGEPGLKSLAIRALERMGTPEALERLEQVAATEKCDQEILDAIDVLETKIPAMSRKISKPDQEAEFSPKDEKLMADLVSDHPHKQFQAFRYFTQSADKVFQAVSRLDATCDLTLRITLLRLVAMTTPPKAVRLLLNILTKENPPASLKFIVYNALHAYPDILGSSAIIKGATDSSAHVRIAALKMLDNHCTDFVIAEIKRKVESSTNTGANLAISILNARAVNIMEKLMTSDSFFYIATQHIEKNASLMVINTFIEALEKRGMQSSAKRYKTLRQKRMEKNLPKIMMVNPSMVCLDAFSARISPIGYETILFRSTQEAFEKLMEEKPAALITGIFLGDMHCIDFINEVRTLYPKEELPIIVSSIMNVNLDDWEKNAGPTGITAWCSFPPKIPQIISWISGKK